MFKNILFSIDINDKYSWRNAFPKIIELYNSSKDCKLTIMNVVQTYGLGMMEEYFPKNWDVEITKKSKTKLNEIVAKNLPANIKADVIIDKGVVYKAIIERAEKIDADLIIISAHHPDRKDYLLGPNVAKVVRHAARSVLVLRD